MKPRNKDLVPMLTRKHGPHGKTKKAVRRAEKVRFMKEFNASVAQLVGQDPFKVEVVGSWSIRRTKIILF